LISARRIGGVLRHVSLMLVAVAVLAAAVLAVAQTPVLAQDQGWSLRDLLFPRRRERIEPPVEIQKPKKKTRSKPVTRKAEPEVPVVEKAPDARTVLVIGDFLASGLAEGLETVFAENPAIRIADRAKGSSGLVRDDFYDWPASIKDMLETEKPVAVVVMLGSNDRQSMQVGDNREQPRSDAWTKQYEQRAEALATGVKAGKVPFLWVGMPSFKISKMTSDMLAFNDIYRSVAEKAGGEFVDIWDGFVDENGAFVSTGPDINGQPVRLRSDDGINMTRAGKAKIAFYAEKPLLKILGLGDPSGTGTLSAPAGQPAVTGPMPPAAPAAVDRTPPMLLSDPALDGGGELLGAAPAPPPTTQAPGEKLPGEKLLVEGVASEASPGRADDFSWPPKAQPATAATAGDKTTAITP
jgi:hypothetical protein